MHKHNSELERASQQPPWSKIGALLQSDVLFFLFLYGRGAFFSTFQSLGFSGGVDVDHMVLVFHRWHLLYCLKQGSLATSKPFD